MQQDTYSCEYVLNDEFFKSINAPDIRKGSMHVHLDVRKSAGGFILYFHTWGQVTVPCDRCLDDLELYVDTTNTLKVKFGAEFSDEEEVVTIPEEGYIDIAWFLYEFIVLSLPMQRMHEQGKCNADMMHVLNRHSYHENDNISSSQETEEIDPRWSELKKILDNN
mgnify:CR=1 FL=1